VGGRAKRQLDRVTQLVKEAQFYSPEIDLPVDTMRGYLNMLIHEDAPVLYRMPLLPMARSHLRRSRFRISMPVDSTNGRAFFSIKPVDLGKGNNDSISSVVPILANSSYNPNSTANAFNAAAGSWTPIIWSNQGINLEQGQIDRTTVVALHLCATITGVSQLEKKGKIYIAQDRCNKYYAGPNSAPDSIVLPALVNTYPLSALSKLYHSKSIEVANMDSKSAIEYHYIPAQGYSTISRTVNRVYTATGSAEDIDENRLIIIIDGADANMNIVLDFEVILQLEPDINYLNTYPVAPSTCYINPDPELRYLENVKDVVLRVNKSEGHLVDQVIPISMRKTGTQNVPSSAWNNLDPKLDYNALMSRYK
jgi:hypothetical protein